VTFTVGVLGAEEQLTALMAVVAQLPNERLADSLNAKLRDARAGLQAGKTNKACGNLADFAKQVAQQAGKGIPAEQADEWQADATSIRPVIGC
jgi:hypothetical protein